jgi:hypothetical protein
MNNALNHDYKKNKHFMVQILFPRSNSVQTVTSFKILNDVLDCTLLDL